MGLMRSCWDYAFIMQYIYIWCCVDDVVLEIYGRLCEVDGIIQILFCRWCRVNDVVAGVLMQSGRTCRFLLRSCRFASVATWSIQTWQTRRCHACSKLIFACLSTKPATPKHVDAKSPGLALRFPLSMPVLGQAFQRRS